MLAELSIVTVGNGTSMSKYIAAAAKIIDESGLKYRINPMSTVIEGDLDEIFGLVKKCHAAVMKDAHRVFISLKLDDRRDEKFPRLDAKIASVEEKVGKKLKK